MGAATHAVIRHPIPYADTRKDWMTVCQEWLWEGGGNCVKLASYASKWFAMAGLGGGEVATLLGPAKEFLGGLKVPLQVAKAGYAVQEGRWRDVVKEGSLCVNAAYDGFLLFTRIVPVSHAVLGAFTGVNCVSTVVGGVNGAVREAEKIVAVARNDDRDLPQKIGLYLINLACNVSYVAAGVLGLVSITGLATVASWSILACLSSGLVWTISAFFYERLVNPEGKQDDPVKVRENHRANYARSIDIQVRLAAAQHARCAQLEEENRNLTARLRAAR